MTENIFINLLKPKDGKEANNWLFVFARKGSVWSMVNLALNCEQGKGEKEITKIG